jgi:RNA polymerase sigma factor (sigma-70 family)
LIRALYILTLALMGTIQILDMPDNDDDLIAQIVASQDDGDRDETKRLFEALYRKHNAAVYARLATLTTKNQADDLAQETWVRILQRLHQYKGGSFRAWMFTIANHLYVDAVRAKRPVLLKAEGEVPDHSVDRERDRAAQSDQARILRDCVSKLKEPHRQVIAGLLYEQSDYKALCVKLGLSADEAYKVKHEAKTLLTDCCRRADR